jgi:hypothetical protein
MPPLFPFDVKAAGGAGGASPRGAVMQAVKSNTESRISRRISMTSLWRAFSIDNVSYPTIIP